MINKSINEIRIDDLHALVVNKISEGSTIEFKVNLNISSDNDKKEFLADISSFANTNGGDIIFGIKAIEGKAVEVPGFNCMSIDRIFLQVESLIRDGLNPRIDGIDYLPIDLVKDYLVLLIRIPRSHVAPHQVTLKGHDKYYARGIAGKYQMDREQLKNAFLKNDVIIDKIDKYVQNRIIDITSDVMPIKFEKTAKVSIHLIPEQSLTDNFIFDVTKITQIREINGGSTTPSYDIHGWLTHSKAPGPGSNNYLRVFRNGIIEAVNGELFYPYQGHLRIPIAKGYNYELFVVEAIQSYLRFYRESKIRLPIHLFISYIGMTGYYIASEVLRYPFGLKTLNQHNINLQRMVIQSYDQDVPSLLKSSFNVIWNACSFEGSINYDENGLWKPLR